MDSRRFFSESAGSFHSFGLNVSEPSYLPTRYRLSQEIIATTVGVLVAAYIISKVPAFKKLVDGNTIWATENNLSTTSSITP
ncbi:hypothetical protein A8D61_02170 [Burkholderia cenocepacia]|nr:hypothetical protein A8D61_02170 [Burkholderia cenocepacia]ONJ17709.1 hypothetical protein A8D82_30705 [Burkholderia cenocepacia]ONN79339.1 hypothetical protein A8D62_34910 [Burkholderia cenocepacia]ONN84128.1 hypothetical protein A8D64_22680 [Burkholderia cenocepacia]ONN91527.1 hypothetical protein A8D63_11270 [Burkholderia cenocepacia]